MLGPLVFPERGIRGAGLRCLNIRPVFGHIIPADSIRNRGVESFLGAIMRISTSRVLRPKSVNSEIFAPVVLRSFAPRIAVARAKFRCPRVGKDEHITGDLFGQST